MKIISQLLSEKSDFSYRLFWNLSGPIFLCLTTFLASGFPELVFWGLLGFFLSCRFGVKGVCASLAVLSLFALKVFLINVEINYPYFLGLVSSYAVSFMITGLNWTRQDLFFDTLFSQIQTKGDCILNLEEELTKSRSDFQKQQLLLLEKIELLQKLLEEASSETASFSILNEVLRKTTAKTLLENQSLQDLITSLEIGLSQIRCEKKELEIELDQITNHSALVEENQKILEQLNASRVELEQTQGINETVARLYAKEYQKTKSLEENLQIIEEKNWKFSEEITLLEEKLSSSYTDSEQMRLQYQALEAKSQEVLRNLEQSSALLQDKETEVQTLGQKIFQMQESLQNFIPKSQYNSLEQTYRSLLDTFDSLQMRFEEMQNQSAPLQSLRDLEEQLDKSKHLEHLYKQLKVQFEEKNQLLHVTRKELFTLDNDRQALEIEQKEMAYDEEPIFRDLLKEVERLDKNIQFLQEENHQLEDLISVMQKNILSDVPKPKKKVQITAEQQTLF